MKKHVVIIGGGASGLIAGIVASQNGAKVTIIEHKDRVGKKILMTGNGKCNLTNLKDYHGKYFSDDLEKTYNILDTFTAENTIDFFKELGLYTKEKRDGGVYPVSEQASAVLDVLRLTAEEYKIKMLLSTDVKAIDYKQKNVDTSSGIIKYDALIIATGGKASPVAGSDGSGYKYAKDLGLKMIKPLPALTGLKCNGNFFKALAGVRTQAKLTLKVNDEAVYTEEGELQLTDYGISGIPVFQFERIAAKALDKNLKVNVRIDFLTYLSQYEIDNILNDKRKFYYKSLEEYLNGLVNKKLTPVICKKVNLDLHSTLGELSEKDFIKCINLLKDFEVNVYETNTFEQAQVTAGGVSLEEVNENLQLVKYKDIYMVGELLDVDGICGGFNLQWAWATGYIAGTHAANN